MPPLDSRIADGDTARHGDDDSVTTARNGHRRKPDEVCAADPIPHPYEATSVMSRVEAERGFLGLALGRLLDPEERSISDYCALIRAVRGRRISAGMFSLPGFRVAFDDITVQRAASDGLPADPRRVFASLAAQAQAEGLPTADGTAFGVSPMMLKEWSDGAPNAIDADRYAWTIARYARAQATSDAVESARGEMARGADPVGVAARLAGRLAELDAEYAAGEDDRDDTLSVTPASEIKIKGTKWLYELRIPIGEITLLAGREGIGKSTVSCSIIARITRGTLAGRHFGTPRGVGIIASEDAWEQVIVPRLVAAGADLTRVFRFEPKTVGKGSRRITVAQDLPSVARLCRKHDIALIVLDPLLSIIDGRTDTHKNAETRAQALEPLVKFAQEGQIAILALIHVTKSGRTDPLESITGSKAFVEVPRSVLFCIKDPAADENDGGGGGYLFCHPKSNLGPEQKSICYAIREVEIDLDPADVEPGDKPYVTTSRVLWGDEDERTAADILGDIGGPQRKMGELAEGIVAWMQGRKHLGVVPVKEIHTEFADTPRRTVDSALSRLVKRGELIRPAQGVYGLNPGLDAGGTVSPLRR